jgi:hypothetical protein
VEIKTDDYSVFYVPEEATVFFQGCLRLDGIEQYQPVLTLLIEAVERSPMLCLNFCELEFLNSSGISMLSMFVVRVRQQGEVNLTLKGSDTILWQTKSLKNLQRLMPALDLTFAES